MASASAAVLAIAVLTACGKEDRQVFLTFVSPETKVSLRYPAGWKQKAQEPDDEGVYRSFVDPEGVVVVSIARQKRTSSQPATERGAHSFSEDDDNRYGRVQILEPETRHDLRVRATRSAWRNHEETIQAVMSSFTLERPDEYSPHADSDFAYRLRIPSSWSKTRALSGDGRAVVVFTSPAIGADEDGIVHASLTLNVERRGAGAPDVLYQRGIERLGEAFRVVRHAPWGTGWVDEMTAETQVSASRIKRFYRLGETYAYVLTFEAPDDVYPRAAAWFDLIAGTFATD